jgi:hypothetical protein
MKRNLNAAIPAADLQAVISRIHQAEALLPFLISLSNEERQMLPKMGSKSVDFVNDASEVIRAFPTIMPPSFDKAEFTKDTNLIHALVTIQMYVDAFQVKVADTLTEVGSEAMMQALEVYAQVQLQQNSVPGLKSAFEKMKSRFQKSRKVQRPLKVKVD